MIPATAWDGDTREWTVLGRARDRQARLRNARIQACRRLKIEEDHHVVKMMTAAAMFEETRIKAAANWTGGFNLLAFLFAHPETDSIRTLDVRGEYFDIRSGSTWDLFFPGYYRSDHDGNFERQCGARPVGNGFANDWYFNPREFDTFRRRIETESAERWQYSGEADLVVATAYLPDAGDLSVDWESVKSAVDICSAKMRQVDAGSSAAWVRCPGACNRTAM